MNFTDNTRMPAASVAIAGDKRTGPLGYDVQPLKQPPATKQSSAYEAVNRATRREEEEETLPQLLDGCRKKNAACQESLYKMFYGYAMAVALKYCIDRDDATEVVNDSFMKVFGKIHTYDRSRPFRPWLGRIVVNTAIDRMRRQFNHHLNIEEIPVQGAMDIDFELSVKEIHSLLEKLPELQRFVFNMYEIDGYSHREIAEELGIGESSSRVYLTRAKTRLRSLYRKYFTGRRNE